MRKKRPKKYYSKEIFAAELLKILKKRGISQDEFNKAVEVHSAVTRWKSGDTTPSAESLLAIKQVFGISIDQLLTGEELPMILREFAPEPYEARPLALIETELLNEAMAKMEEVLKAEKQKIRSEDKAMILTQVYNDCAEERIKPDAIMVKRYLWKILDQSRR
jgi:transcriptional regulator with XRE-family HTH domain